MKGEIEPVKGGHSFGTTPDPFDFTPKVRLRIKGCKTEYQGKENKDLKIFENIHLLKVFEFQQ